ncbi:hypothetical protein WKK05_12935 [Nostoc sp. UHCC 0302]|uniref:hypothetical protein n=1 Tax=Nostoc sp. UHCC 0302 TaxID=3134896 RepID=UPI00311CB58A
MVKQSHHCFLCSDRSSQGSVGQRRGNVSVELQMLDKCDRRQQIVPKSLLLLRFSSVFAVSHRSTK